MLLADFWFWSKSKFRRKTKPVTVKIITIIAKIMEEVIASILARKLTVPPMPRFIKIKYLLFKYYLNIYRHFL